MSSKPHILLCNDDGIHAPGLYHLWRALRTIADITIVAPSTEQSGKSVSNTFFHPLQIEKVRWEENTPAHAVNGTPADCIKMALSVILKSPPDLIVSGINAGSNAGRNVLYSGTVGAVIEGTMRGVKGVAVSCLNFDTPRFEVAEKYIALVIQYVLKTPFPKGTFLNVNFPDAEEIEGFKFARQGNSYCLEDPDTRTHPTGRTYYWLGGKHVTLEEHQDSDIKLLSQGYMTAVPIHIADLTDKHLLASHRDSFEKLFQKSPKKAECFSGTCCSL